MNVSFCCDLFPCVIKWATLRLAEMVVGCKISCPPRGLASPFFRILKKVTSFIALVSLGILLLGVRFAAFVVGGTMNFFLV